MRVKQISDSTFEAEVINETIPVLVEFMAGWNDISEKMSPALEDLARSLEGKVKIVRIDVDANPVSSSKFKILSVPILMLFVDGIKRSVRVGGELSWKQHRGNIERWLRWELE